MNLSYDVIAKYVYYTHYDEGSYLVKWDTRMPKARRNTYMASEIYYSDIVAKDITVILYSL